MKTKPNAEQRKTLRILADGGTLKYVGSNKYRLTTADGTPVPIDCVEGAKLWCESWIVFVANDLWGITAMGRKAVRL